MCSATSEARSLSALQALGTSPVNAKRPVKQAMARPRRPVYGHSPRSRPEYRSREASVLLIRLRRRDARCRLPAKAATMGGVRAGRVPRDTRRRHLVPVRAHRTRKIAQRALVQLRARGVTARRRGSPTQYVQYVKSRAVPAERRRLPGPSPQSQAPCSNTWPTPRT